jgi:hypothetical protein
MRRNEAATHMTVREQVQPMVVSIFRVVDGKVAEQWLFSTYPLSSPRVTPSEAQSKSGQTGGYKHRRKKRRR